VIKADAYFGTPEKDILTGIAEELYFKPA